MKKIWKKSRYILLFGVLSLLIWFIPFVGIILGFWIICGLLDVSRNRPINKKLLKRYFLGNGMLTWLLSPFNLLVDLFCQKNKHIYKLDDYPIEHRKEIKKVLALFDEHKDSIAAELKKNMSQSRRKMLFFKWFGKNYNQLIPEFNEEFSLIKTIGVSVFSPNESTTWHYGPLRVSLRVLYNLFPAPGKDAYITTQGKTHYWSDSAFFSFDDTLFHRSANDTDELRYCAFIDIERPTAFPNLLKLLSKKVSLFFHSIRGVFYKNWDLVN